MKSLLAHIWTVEGWLYLAAVKDLYTKQVVGYSLNKKVSDKPGTVHWEFLKQNCGSLRIRTAQLTISEICFIAI
ncbi:hypothetical protein HPJ32_10260, partial [Acinetobacter baumannii]|nr:hypothetical protein [Acinetobacter baumannii]